MAVRIRENGQVLCAAMHPKLDTDLYIDDAMHYYLSVEMKVLVTEAHERHSQHGQWWWINQIPENVIIDEFYLT